MRQQTLKSSFKVTGVGLHSGKEYTLKLLPAPANTGYRIRRIDLDGKPEIPVFAEMVDFTDRCTKISCAQFSVATIEHALSALYGMGVDNCILEVDGSEFPILTGSAIPYVEGIKSVGIETQQDDRDIYIVKKTFEVEDPDTGARLILFPREETIIEANLQYDSNPPGRQHFTFCEKDSYEEAIASARSYVFVSEVIPLLHRGLIKGGSISNALIIKDRELTTEEETLLRKEIPDYKTGSTLGYINPSENLGENEPARHKILDLLGDLALAGRYFRGHLIATKPGHTINNKLARLLRNEIKQSETQEPYYNPDDDPILNIEQIRELLPHRYPFLLVDKVIEMGHNSIVGLKAVTGNEPFFEGHFPDEPVMPGVLIVEALAQTGGLLVINALKDEGTWSTYLLKIDNVKFRRKVVPGDTLLFCLKLLTEIRRGIARMRGLAFVGSRVVCEAEFTAQIVKNNPREEK